jgi:hypothetical protein
MAIVDGRFPCAMSLRQKKLFKRILEKKRRTGWYPKKVSPNYLGDSLGTKKKALPKSGKADAMRFLLVVPTGIEPVSPP